MQQKTVPDTRFNLEPSASLTRVLPMPLVNPTFSFHNHLPAGGAFTMSLDVFAMCSVRVLRWQPPEALGVQIFEKVAHSILQNTLPVGNALAQWQLKTRKASRSGFISPFQTFGPTSVGMLSKLCSRPFPMHQCRTAPYP